ncbi:MAG: hypothetical protein EXQ86_04950 [Rhodospirillales bacterium]|nr:hypothetical protein [Rhodospirillales bacterium]
MTQDVLFSASAILALLPACATGMRRNIARDSVFWASLALAVLGPLTWSIVRMDGAWRADLSTTLWVTVSASMVVFAVVSVVTREGWRLLPLIAGYLGALGVIAMLWQNAPDRPLAGGGTWIHLHIAVSIATYALLTVGAIAALAAFLHERSLKAKRGSNLSRWLPSVADSERLVVRLLVMGQVVLAVGLASGMAVRWGEHRTLLVLDHKTILTIAAFLVNGALLVLHYRWGVRGRQAARLVLLGYLLLTLGYPGVKFVTDVILA